MIEGTGRLTFESIISKSFLFFSFVVNINIRSKNLLTELIHLCTCIVLQFFVQTLPNIKGFFKPKKEKSENKPISQEVPIVGRGTRRKNGRRFCTLL